MTSTWEILSKINVNPHLERKNGLSYLSWAWAWALTKQACPDASYRIINFDGKPYLFDADLGYMIQTEVTINHETLPMHLFVMDGANKAQKNTDYKYATKYGEKTCVAATMFDINTATMRCLTKNLAMHGLGICVYAGEDLPRGEDLPIKKEKEWQQKPSIRNDLKNEFAYALINAPDLEGLKLVWAGIPANLQPDLKDVKNIAKAQLMKPSVDNFGDSA